MTSTAAPRSGPWSAAVRAHWQTWRPYTLAYPGLVGLAGAALADGPSSPGPLLVAWAAPTLGWVSGHYLGDYFDRDLDAIGKPQRPIPSGRLSPRAAVVWGVACALAAGIAAALANWRAVLLVAAAMAGIVAYSRLLKGVGLSGNVVRGFLTATTLVFGAMAVDVLPPWRVLPFALAFWAHDAASNLVGTLRDIEGDRDGGYRTFPVRHGARTATRAAALLYATALATALAAVPPVTLVTDDRVACLALLLLAVACGTYAFAPLLRDPSSFSARRALRAHEVLVAERLVLAGALLAGSWGPGPAVAVLGPLLAVSLLAQARMRAGHEFPESGPPAEERGPERARVSSGPVPAPAPSPEPPGGGIARATREDDVPSC